MKVWLTTCPFTTPSSRPFLLNTLLPTKALNANYALQWSNMNIIARVSPTCTLPNHETFCSLFYYFSISLYFPYSSSSFPKLSSLILMIFLSTLLLPLFSSRPPSPTLTLQRSSRNRGVCHCVLAVELRTVHNYVIHRNLGEETQKHGETEREWGEGETRNMPCRRAPLPIDAHTRRQTLPLLCSNNGSIATHKCTRTGSGGTGCKITPQNQARRWANKKNPIELHKEKSTLLCLQVCEALKRKKNREGQRENFSNRTPILQLYCHYACFAWLQTMTITLKAKLSQVHLKAFCWNRRMTNKESTTLCEY